MLHEPATVLAFQPPVADQIRRDARRWHDDVEPIVGPTDVFVYAFGTQPPPGSPKIDLLRDLGFTIQCGIDKVARLIHTHGVSLMARRHIDGIAFDQLSDTLTQFFAVRSVEDTAARTR